MTLTTRERKQAAKYLAVIHATGCKLRGMHNRSNWSLTVHLGYTSDYTRMDGRFHTLTELGRTLVEGHPLLASIDALRAQGFTVDYDRIGRLKRWTISDGIPMRHTEDLRTVTLYVDGYARQYDNAEGKWEYKVLGNPGKEQKGN